MFSGKTSNRYSVHSAAKSVKAADLGSDSLSEEYAPSSTDLTRIQKPTKEH